MSAGPASGSPPHLSRTRTALFGALAIVWFSEMVLWGFPALSHAWTQVWKMMPSGNPQLAAALAITHSAEAPLKGALGVLAVLGLRSRNPSARTALFMSMALVPPLNIAFQFRAQGFPPKSVAVASVFSIILWGSLLLFREAAQQPDAQGAPSRREAFQYVWFAFNSALLTLLALLFLLGPRMALYVLLPCWSPLLEASRGEVATLAASNLGTGSHLLALATASWVTTVHCRSNPALRKAVTAASTVNAGLVCLLPLRQILAQAGRSCATSSVLVLFVPLFVGWVLYAAFSRDRSL